MDSASGHSPFHMTSAASQLAASLQSTNTFSGSSLQQTVTCTSFGYATILSLQLAPTVPVRLAAADALNLQTHHVALSRASAHLRQQTVEQTVDHKNTIVRHRRLQAQHHCPAAVITSA